MKKRILFVCLGNICRSPAAEGVACALSNQLSLDLFIDSAGTGNYHIGAPPHLEMRRVAAERGFSIDDLRARQIQNSDFSDFDLIVAMDRHNLNDLIQLNKKAGGNVEIRLLRNDGQDIPDPYYGTLDDFYHSFDMIWEGVEDLLKE